MIIKLTSAEQKNIKIKYVGKRNLSNGYIKDRDLAWDELVESGRLAGKKFWNGELYTFERIIQYDQENITLELGSCEYKDRLFKKKIGPKGIESKYGKNHLQIHCGVNCFLYTTDKKLVIGRKKSSIGLDKNILAFISGNLNKDELKVNSFLDIIKSIKNEVEEEANIILDFNKIKFNQINHFSTYFNFEFLYPLEFSSKDVSQLNKDDEFIEFMAYSPKEIANLKEPLITDLKYSLNYILDIL